MSDTFDPYYLWLGIPPHQQPPNHYRLLGLNLFETDVTVISQAADRQMAYVRSLQSGPQGAASQKLLNELARARACLESVERRRAYDAQLRAADGNASAETPAKGAGTTAQRIKVEVRNAAPPGEVPGMRLAWWSLAAMIIAGMVVGILIGVLLPNGGPSGDGGESPRPVPGAKAPIASGPNAPPGDSPNAAPRPPEGVTAESIVIWNQRHAGDGSRGSKTGRLILTHGNRKVWSSAELAFDWAADKDLPTTVELPEVRFDQARVFVDQWHGRGGGLAEMEVIRGGENIARLNPVRSSVDYGANYRATRMADGVRDSTTLMTGYWLLPDRTPGWISIDMAAAANTSASIVADTIVLWNSHNARHNNGGVLRCNVILMKGDKIVWRVNDHALLWVPSEKSRSELTIPRTEFDRVRIEVTESHETAGLAEVEVWQNGTNVALGSPVETSSIYSGPYAAERLVDGIVDSNVSGVGYWHARRTATAWIELDLRCADRDAGRRWREIGEYYCYEVGDWPRGLAWLARCADPELRLLARRELENHPSGAEHFNLAIQWLERAERQTARAAKAQRLRAAWHFARVRLMLRESARREMTRQVEQLTGDTDHQHLLYFHTPVSQSGIRGGHPAYQLVSVNSVPSAFGLWAHPEADASSSIRYQIDRKYRRLEGAVAINDSTVNQSQSPLVFSVRGDGKTLWESQPTQHTPVPVSFSADVSGISIVELVVECSGSNGWAHAVWLDPRLVPQ